jgi:hypothetical protein
MVPTRETMFCSSGKNMAPPETEVLDEAWMKRNGRVREWANAYPRYAASILFGVLAPILYTTMSSGSFVAATLPSLCAGLSVNCAMMGYKGS